MSENAAAGLGAIGAAMAAIGIVAAGIALLWKSS
jgi:hypothetical protein